MIPKPDKDQKFPLNFRPISLISSIGKIYEKNLLKRIEKYTLNNSIIPEIQHGFRKETSTCHQLLRATNIIISGFNNHATTGGIFLDVEKAFDRLWHNGLISKMINLNNPPYLIHTISDYLHNRTFQVKIQATISKIGHIQAGSPQGSLLSPILYNIYTYDFPTSPLVDICLFADDAATSANKTPRRNDEAHFWLNGYVNKQNCRIWSEANPQVYVETPLHPEKLTVWCALWAGGILLQKRRRPQRYSQW
ncbi:probable RNA-directed DNA polymerase from transposon X-element [Trichonephila clavipes]|nr:probable RNA-directed DNA polymerase from transposon X-element [Trichonephila clavipes]